MLGEPQSYYSSVMAPRIWQILWGECSQCLPREGELGEGRVDLLITILELDVFYF